MFLAIMFSGYAARYAPGLMERVADRRGMERSVCMIAADLPLKTTVLVRGPVGERECVVVDVPYPRDVPMLRRRQIVVELDHESALAVCGSVVDPPSSCPVDVELDVRPVVVLEQV